MRRFDFSPAGALDDRGERGAVLPLAHDPKVTTMNTCNRCEAPSRHGSRRFRCVSCKGLVCARCCSRGGSGQGANSTRWAKCYDCWAKQDAAHQGVGDRSRRSKCPSCKKVNVSRRHISTCVVTPSRGEELEKGGAE